MKMTRELARFWELWGLYSRVHGVKRSDNAARHKVIKTALGYPRSTKDFTHAEFDVVYTYLLTVINGYEFSSDLYKQTLVDGSRARKIYRILQEAPSVYAAKIAQDKFQTREWTELDLQQLEQLRITIIQRARSLKKRKGVKASLYDTLKAPSETPF